MGYIHYNPLLGNFNIAPLLCVKNGLYSASLLPNTAIASLLGFNGIFETSLSISTTEINDKSTPLVAPLLTLGSIRIAKQTGVVGLVSSSSFQNTQVVELKKIFAINLIMMLRCIVNAMILAIILVKTSFTRELRNGSGEY